MSVAATIEAKLRAAFSPTHLAIVNDSAKHAHHAEMRHAGAAGAATGETHFTIVIAAPAFAGKSLVERHRMVNKVLAAELAGPVHALSIKATADAPPVGA
jgi:BolA protein